MTAQKHKKANKYYDCGTCSEETQEMRHCPKQGYEKSYCAMAEMDTNVITAFRAKTLMDKGLVGLRDLDAWAYYAAEVVSAEEARAASCVTEDKPQAATGEGTELKIEGF